MLKDYLYIYNNSETSDDEESDVSLDEASLRKTKRGKTKRAYLFLIGFFTYALIYGIIHIYYATKFNLIAFTPVYSFDFL